MDMSKANYGILHCHSEFSVKDSAMPLSAMVARANELGAPALALTDHGILTGFYDFMRLCKEHDIKPIPGIEAYYTPASDEELDTDKTKQHLILMARDMTGYQAICEAVYRSYAHAVDDYPRMTTDILLDCFGPGAEGHDHVFATSACIQGPLGQILLERQNAERNAEKLYRKRDKYPPIDDEFLDAVKKEEELALEIETLIIRRGELEADSKINLTGLKRRLKAATPGDAEYAELEAELDTQTKRKEHAKEGLSAIKKEIAAKRRAKTEYSKSIAALKTSGERWTAYNTQIEEMLAAVRPDGELYSSAKEAAALFCDIFGDGNFFIELQNHRMMEESIVMPQLAQLAKELDIPVVAANDAHYATDGSDDIRARTLVAAMRFNTVIEDETLEEGYGELYMKPDGDLLSILSEIIDEDIARQALENISVIVNGCDVQLTREEHYPVFVGGLPGETTDVRLRRLAEEGIPKKYPGGLWTKDLQVRMDYELEVINSQGYSDYLCIVQDFLEYGRSLAKDYPGGAAYTIGPGRGSAVGSLVCYLCGITSVDPIRYDLLFERFLNKDRVSMPDIDSDFHTEIRVKVIDYVRSKYGERAVCNIITKGTMAGKSAIRSVGRVTDTPDSIVDMVARMIPSTPNAKIDDAPDLEAVCKTNAVANRLVNDARLVEGTVVNYGMHAAGVIISDNGNVGKYVPLMYNSAKEQWVAQCDMGQCENDAGLLKMDFLGLRNLDIITDTLQRIYKNYGRVIDMESVPLEPEVFSEIFSRGKTSSVFQFESAGMRNMLKRFRPSSMEDIILLVAAYRPGPMKYIPDITAVKNGSKTPTYIADGLEDILKVTYGYTIYQEQVMQIFNKVAGFSLGEADIIRRAMGKKKLAILTDPKTDYHGKFIKGLMARGASEQDAEGFWNELLDFASYAFNKSHAAAYAHIAYYTAYLKYHYPAEYMCSVMTRTAFEKLPSLINECRQMGLTVAPPDINRSSDDFINVGETILFGFGNIKGVGSSGEDIVAERKQSPFVSFKDFIYRTTAAGSSSITKAVVTKLIEAGAFDAFCDGNRQSLLSDVDSFSDTTRKLKDMQEKYNVLLLQQGEQDEETPEKKRKALERSIATTATKLSALRDAYATHTFLMVPEDPNTKMAREHELLGFYVSGNPIDDYADAIRLVPKAVPISDVESTGDVTLCGIVSNLEVHQRKSDGRPFCSFLLFDRSGEIEVKCFTKEYPKFEMLIEDGAALTISGQARQTEARDDFEDETAYYVMAKEIRKLSKLKKERIVISAASILEWVEHYETIRSYEQSDGYECFFNDQTEMRLRRCEFRVSKDLLSLNIPSLLISMMPVA